MTTMKSHSLPCSFFLSLAIAGAPDGRGAYHRSTSEPPPQLPGDRGYQGEDPQSTLGRRIVREAEGQREYGAAGRSPQQRPTLRTDR